uniref:ANK_REP_REGION domain-containing protein n=1 Tax=Caenorhabditis japonica TaxID=281687 RepID=A0A8R1EG08_CAEJA
MSVRVRFSQERPGITYVPSSRSGNAPLLADILSKPMPIIHQDNRFLMDACTAASIGDESMLKQLMKINPNTIVMKNQSGWTPLLYAAYLGHNSVTAFLLDNGAKLAFAISINKAQDESFGRVGLYLPEDVFAHGQTYVALSRARSKNELFIKSTSERLFNVVYKEIL